MSEVQQGDEREGIGTYKIRVRVLAVEGNGARCKLLRSGDTKLMSLTTLQKAYRLVGRGCQHCGHTIDPTTAATKICPDRDGDFCEPRAPKASP